MKNNIPSVSQRYTPTSSRDKCSPFVVLAVIEDEKRVFAKHDGSNRKVSIRFDTIRSYYRPEVAKQEAKQPGFTPTQSLQEMINVAVATAMHEHERRHHSNGASKVHAPSPLFDTVKG